MQEKLGLFLVNEKSGNLKQLLDREKSGNFGPVRGKSYQKYKKYLIMYPSERLFHKIFLLNMDSKCESSQNIGDKNILT